MLSKETIVMKSGYSLPVADGWSNYSSELARVSSDYDSRMQTV